MRQRLRVDTHRTHGHADRRGRVQQRFSPQRKKQHICAEPLQPLAAVIHPARCRVIEDTMDATSLEADSIVVPIGSLEVVGM